jgi:hypothetical protein
LVNPRSAVLNSSDDTGELSHAAFYSSGRVCKSNSGTFNSSSRIRDLIDFPLGSGGGEQLALFKNVFNSRVRFDSLRIGRGNPS